MRALLAIVGLGALALAIAAYVEPPQSAVLIDLPLAADPLDDLNLNNGGNE